ncbi:hypothetical protein [Polyangium aurulentum]|uniref:hypothetical protein n=1 Tax=Polyangium aurulentum TaxID=2567896 RepID=UPI00146A4F45|nr:hypothetical protein [Polyangium aurulentum]UQA56470.1 hypothetical protein E8A73_034920 [Polyangium aurulentum]
MVLRNILSVLLPLVVMACGGAVKNEPEMAPPAPVEPQPPSPSAAAPPTPPAAAPAVEAAPAKAPAPDAASAQASPEPWFELSDSPGAPELADGAAAVSKEDWQKARIKLDRAVAAMADKAPLDARLAGHALLGRTCAKLKDDKCADKAFSAVLAAWKDPAAARAALDAGGGDEDARKQRQKRAILAVGEAKFFKAEQRREELDRLKMPTMPGNKKSHDREAVLQHIQTRVVPWRDQKMALVEEVEKEYRAIATLAPSPRWTVDASARVSMLWGRFTAEHRAAPIPAEWRGKAHDELRAYYYEEIDRTSAPIKERMYNALVQCRADSKKLGHEDEMSRACLTMLEKMFPGR